MSRTRVIKADALDVDEAAGIIRDGGLVIIPTETVYGIAANMLNEKALERLRKIKNRPQEKQFSVHIDEKLRIEEFAKRIPTAAYKLIAKFWPGPLTIILKSKDSGTVGLRMPDNEVALKIIKKAAIPVICPSANISGNPAPLDIQEALKDLDGLVDLAIDAGKTKLGIESTVVDLTQDNPEVLREGAIKKTEIEAIAKKKSVLFVCTGNSCRSVMAEALLKKKLKEKNRNDVEVSSAGIMRLGGMGATESTKEVLRYEGVDVSAHLSRSLTKEIVKSSDIILVMERLHEQKVLELAPEAKNRLFLLKEFAKIKDNNLDVPDPIGRPLGFYQNTLGIIKEAVERIVEII